MDLPVGKKHLVAIAVCDSWLWAALAAVVTQTVGAAFAHTKVLESSHVKDLAFNTNLVDKDGLAVEIQTPYTEN